MPKIQPCIGASWRLYEGSLPFPRFGCALRQVIAEPLFIHWPSSRQEPAEANAYVALVREHGERFIEILQSIRDTSPDSRARLAAATCLSEFNCESPGAVAAESAAFVPTIKSKPEYTLDELDAGVAEVSAAIVAQFGQAELDKILVLMECV